MQSNEIFDSFDDGINAGYHLTKINLVDLEEFSGIKLNNLRMSFKKKTF